MRRRLFSLNPGFRIGSHFALGNQRQFQVDLCKSLIKPLELEQASIWADGLRFGHHRFDVRNSIKQSKLCGCALIQHEYNDSDFSISRIPVNGCVNATGSPRYGSFRLSSFVIFGCRFCPS